MKSLPVLGILWPSGRFTPLPWEEVRFVARVDSERARQKKCVNMSAKRAPKTARGE